MHDRPFTASIQHRSMREQQIHLRGTSFLCREQGLGDPLVLVHGNVSDMRSWEPLELHLAKHFRVVNYSRRFAHPNAPIPAGADDPLSQHVDDLEALIERLQLGRVHLLGNSSGAFICLLLAQRRPDLVRSLTLEEPPVISLFLRTLPPSLGHVLQLLVSSPMALLDLLRFGAGTIDAAIKAFKAGEDDQGLALFVRGVLGSEAARRLTYARRQQMRDNLAPHRAALLGSGLPAFTRKDAASIHTPTLLLGGSQSPRFQQRINEHLARLMPHARRETVPGASHFVHEDRPYSVAGAVFRFCIEVH